MQKKIRRGSLKLGAEDAKGANIKTPKESRG